MVMRTTFLLCFVCCFGNRLLAEIITVNINNNNSSGDLFVQNETVSLGDVIRFTNNLNYTLTNTEGVMDAFLNTSGGSQPVNLAPGAFFEVVVDGNTPTEFYFIHDHFAQNNYYNTKLTLTVQSTASLAHTVREQGIRVAMNSGSPYVEVSAETDVLTAVSVFTASGSAVLHLDQQAGKRITVDCSVLQSGYYLILVETLSGTLQKRVFKP